MNVWVAFDGNSDRILGVSRSMDLSDLGPHQSLRIIWKPYVPSGNIAAFSSDGGEMFSGGKAKLKAQVRASWSSSLRDQAVKWLAEWFEVHPVPARTIAAHWSDEPAPEAK